MTIHNLSDKNLSTFKNVTTVNRQKFNVKILLRAIKTAKIDYEEFEGTAQYDFCDSADKTTGSNQQGMVTCKYLGILNFSGKCILVTTG